MQIYDQSVIYLHCNSSEHRSKKQLAWQQKAKKPDNSS
jgi:hypothetical protein